MLPMRLQQMLRKANTWLINKLADRYEMVPVAIDKTCIEFYYKGDCILYVWPWKRDRPEKWISLSFQAYYPTLAAMDKEWDEYFEHTAMPGFRKDID